MANNLSSVNDILDKLEELADNADDVSVGDVTEALGGRGFGPLIVVPALLTVSPLGGIPTVPTLMAIIILLFAIQILIGRKHLWLPDLIEDRAVKDKRIRDAADKLRGVAGWLDVHLGNRLDPLVKPPMPRVAAAIIAGLCLLVPPSEVIPFAALVPMGAIAVIGLALTLRDGLLMLVGLIGAAGALYALWAGMV